MKCPSCHDFSQVRTIVHISFSWVNWSVASFRYFMNSYMWIFFNNFFHKKHSLLLLVRNWRAKMVTIFKADFSSSKFLNPSAHGVVWNILGSTYIYQISMDFHAIFSQVHPCKHIERKLLSSWIHFFQAQLMTSYFYLNHIIRSHGWLCHHNSVHGNKDLSFSSYKF